ncbi:MAG: ECF transporter S component [Catonella sp.]|uniref:ECF transporter S component n=1 Tax=Catonella sp. TaxID=2382125 RepID=UPI003F9F0332
MSKMEKELRVVGGTSENIKKLALAALFAALSYIGFQVFRFDIPVGTDKTAFHLGNTFVALGALFIGGAMGGAAGAVGLTIADLTSGYATSAPKTFILKLLIGLIVGLIAHRGFKINEISEKKKLLLATVLSAGGGLMFNIVADPLVGYIYKQYVLGMPQEISAAFAKIAALTTSVNAVTSVVFSTLLYLALRPVLKKEGFLG